MEAHFDSAHGIDVDLIGPHDDGGEHHLDAPPRRLLWTVRHHGWDALQAIRIDGIALRLTRARGCLSRLRLTVMIDRGDDIRLIQPRCRVPDERELMPRAHIDRAALPARDDGAAPFMPEEPWCLVAD